VKLDGELQNSYFAPCWDCRHKNDPFDNKCKAFPKGVPTSILSGKSKHTKKHPDQDNDIVFEPMKED